MMSTPPAVWADQNAMDREEERLVKELLHLSETLSTMTGRIRDYEDRKEVLEKNLDIYRASAKLAAADGKNESIRAALVAQWLTENERAVQITDKIQSEERGLRDLRDQIAETERSYAIRLKHLGYLTARAGGVRA